MTKYRIRNGFINGKDSNGDLEYQDLGPVLNVFGLPMFRFDGSISPVSEEEQMSSQEWNDIVIANRSLRYKKESDPLLAEYLYMFTTSHPDADAKRQDWVDAVEKIKEELPKNEVTWSYWS